MFSSLFHVVNYKGFNVSLFFTSPRSSIGIHHLWVAKETFQCDLYQGPFFNVSAYETFAVFLGYKMYTEPDKDFLCQNCLVHESGHSDCVIPACETCIILSEMLQYREGVSASFLDGTLVVDIPDKWDDLFDKWLIL